MCQPLLFVLAEAGRLRCLVRLVCEDHGTQAGTVDTEELIFCAAELGRRDILENGRLRHGG